MDTVSADLRFVLDSLQRERHREILRMLDEKSFKNIVKQAESLFNLIDKATND